MSIRSFKRAHSRRLDRERRRFANAKRRGALVVGAALGASALMASNADAAAYTVTTTGDGAGSCSAGSCTTLRAAVNQANTDNTAATISFANGVAPLITVGTPLTITDVGGVTINGPGAGTLAISGGNTSQIIDITAAENTHPVAISGLTLENGNSGSVPGGAIEDYSGNTSTGSPPLSLTNVTVTGSTTANSTSGGGGIYSSAPVTISGSTISGNTAPNGDGGGLFTGFSNSSSNKYDVNITGSTVTGNTAQRGGGVAGGNNIAITNSHITGNHAIGSTSGGLGGGIYADTAAFKLTGSTVSGNTSTNVGGGIEALTKYGTSISNSTISGNHAPASGGLNIVGVFAFPGGSAKYNPVKVDHSTISGNQATFGGAGVGVKYAAPGTRITLQSSTITGNQGASGSFGGGLLLGSGIYEPIRVIDSTISGNAATHGGGVSVGYGGSTDSFFGSNGKGSVAFDNSTVAANTATGGGGGGGVYLAEYTNGNSGPKRSPIASISSTIVSGNTAAGVPEDLARAATATSGGFDAAFSLIQHPGTAPILGSHALITGVSPELGPLANNGGPTQTMLPSGNSPVIDRGHADARLVADQRGDQRTVDVAGMPNPSGGDGTDIGAVELPASSVVVPKAGLSAKIHHRLLGGPKTPLLTGSSTPVICAVKIGTLSSCVINIRSKGGKLLASGAASTSHSHKTLTAQVTLTAAGSAALEQHPGGVTGVANVFGSTSRSGSQTVHGKVRLRAHSGHTAHH